MAFESDRWWCRLSLRHSVSNERNATWPCRIKPRTSKSSSESVDSSFDVLSLRTCFFIVALGCSVFFEPATSFLVGEERSLTQSLCSTLECAKHFSQPRTRIPRPVRSAPSYLSSGYHLGHNLQVVPNSHRAHVLGLEISNIRRECTKRHSTSRCMVMVQK